MAREERLHKIVQMLHNGQSVPRLEFERRLEVSTATLKRDIEYLRSRLGAPIVWDAHDGGYRLQGDASQGSGWAPPGLWLDSSEVLALLTMHHLLERLDAGGLLAPHIGPLRQRLGRMLGSGQATAAEVQRRIRVMSIAARPANLPEFQQLATAVLQRKRLRIVYSGRSSGSTGERQVSPQRLVHYRDNWYLDAWCHERQALRTFSVDRVVSALVLDEQSIELREAQLDAELASGYGIFSGTQLTTVRLRFSAERSRWVAAEHWHPQQQGRFDSAGRWNLEFPYADPRELMMDIQRHVPDVEVLWPQELADAVLDRLRQSVRRMEGELDE